MTDEEAVRRVIAEYCQYIDDLRIDEFVDLYATDATHERGGETFSGHEQIAGFARGTGVPPERVGRHVCCNSIIDVQGHSASAVTDFIHLRWASDGSLFVNSTGRYHDRFVKQADRWRFASRKVVHLTKESH